MWKEHASNSIPGSPLQPYHCKCPPCMHQVPPAHTQTFPAPILQCRCLGVSACGRLHFSPRQTLGSATIPARYMQTIIIENIRQGLKFILKFRFFFWQFSLFGSFSRALSNSEYIQYKYGKHVSGRVSDLLLQHRFVKKFAGKN